MGVSSYRFALGWFWFNGPLGTHAFDHLFNCRRSAHTGEMDRRVLILENSEDLVGKCLANHLDSVEVKNDLREAVQSAEKPLRL